MGPKEQKRQMSSSDGQYFVGQRVQCFYDDDYYDGYILRQNSNGSYFIQFEDGDVLEDAVASEIKLLETVQEVSGTVDILSIPEFAVVPSTDTNWLRPNNAKSAATAEVRSTVPTVALRELSPLEKILAAVEEFILPLSDERYLIKRNKVPDKDVLPTHRLSHLLTQVCIAEHIRTMQTLYRDFDDEMKLAGELRSDNPNAKLPTKLLVTKITEGRARIYALCRQIFGDNSFQQLRAKIDLANCYALQGMWPQVAEHMTVIKEALLNASAYMSTTEFTFRLRRAILCAFRIQAIYRTLR